jgi:hypothetical protein
MIEFERLFSLKKNFFVAIKLKDLHQILKFR